MSFSLTICDPIYFQKPQITHYLLTASVVGFLVRKIRQSNTAVLHYGAQFFIH